MKNDNTVMNAYYTLTEGCSGDLLGLNVAFLMESRKDHSAR